ncbi:hypothetical protein ISF_02183 [Cordyceps fumosorosea ARSEF 2679]|uniref:HNH nuclease domain-containing protein n=1 Tax=Cordyceps fumosorosea (strain ARSEF 2679) TaxID=1081104 RepID=A0A162JNW3_CORFA|nr:hypothetical protein ISF_02183 [Cordyceps fumosorosea ARSEF 2679]OAA71632.1 hypothetical protein ISF_02183 [Cordyceps fumosorosea ARSEF 2679]
MTSSETAEGIALLAKHFCDDKDVHPEEISFLRRMLLSNQERVQPMTTDPEEQESKVQLIRAIQLRYCGSRNRRNNNEERIFREIHFAGLFVLPKAELQALARDHINEINNYLGHCLPVVKQIVFGLDENGAHPKDYDSDADSSAESDDDDDESGPPTPSSSSTFDDAVLYMTYKPELRLRRLPGLLAETMAHNDGCVLSGARNPVEIAHIFALESSNTSYAINTLKALWHSTQRMFGPEITATVSEFLFREPGAADESWNTICLSRSLHRAWDLNLFGLEPLPEQPKPHTIRVRLEWFCERHGQKWKREVEPSTKLLTELAEDVAFHREFIAQYETNVVTGRRLLTDNIYEIKGLTAYERSGMVAALAARWRAQVVLFTAGAAGMPGDMIDYVNHEEDDVVKMMAHLAEQASTDVFNEFARSVLPEKVSQVGAALLDGDNTTM